MKPNETMLLIIIAYLGIKHFLGDFVLQTKDQVANKSIYGHKDGIAHAAVHGLLSLPLLVFFPALGFINIALLVVGESLAHYHIDWGKEQIARKKGWRFNDPQFWWIFGLDQLLHFLSYLLIAALIIRWI